MYVVYLTIYRGTKLPPYYIGSTSFNKIENGYCGSVTSKKYKEIFNSERIENFNLFDVIVLLKYDTRIEALEMELHLQKEFDVVKSNSFFNESYASINGMFGRDVSGSNNPMYGKKQSESAKKIMSEKRGNEKRYEQTEEHRKISSHTHKGKFVSDETRSKISKAKKGKYVGVNNPQYGKKHSDETKQKISVANKGKVVSEETREKLSKANKGRIVSEEEKLKVSKAKKGKKRGKFSLKWRQNISKANKGKKMSVEAKEKLIKSKTGMKYRESTCPHCEKTGGGGNMLRYHFDNCKFKLNTEK